MSLIGHDLAEKRQKQICDADTDGDGDGRPGCITMSPVKISFLPGSKLKENQCPWQNFQLEEGQKEKLYKKQGH